MEASPDWTGGEREVVATATRAFRTLIAEMRSVLERSEANGAPNMVDGQVLAPRMPPAVGRADRLTRQLLAYAGGQRLTPSKLELNPFLCNLANALRRALDARIAVSVDVSQDCPSCYVDADALEEALLNLVANARDAMPDGGSLQFSAKAVPAPDGSPAVAVSVSDSGMGMAADFAPSAMRPFVSTKSHEPLAGMGLAATEGFARQSGGFLTLSCPVGLGVTATLTLPQSASSRSLSMGLAVDRSGLVALTRDIIQSASDAIVTADEGQIIVMANPAAALIFRCPIAELVGAPLERFIPQRYRANHRHDIRAFGDTETATRHMGRAREVMGLRADGEEFPIDAAISHLNSGDRRLYTVIMRDMSEQRFAEAALRESEARLQRVLKLLPEAVVVNSGNRISFVNEATQRLLGADSAALLGRAPSELFQPDSIVVEKARVLGLQSSPGVPLIEERIVRADGAERIGEVTATLIEDRGETSILAVIRDVTELRQTRSALAQSHADLQRLFTAQDRIQEEERSRIARELHDALQQPLAVIRMNAHELRERVMTDPASVTPLLAEIDRLASSAAESTRRILNDLRPQMLEDLGLTPALEMLASQFSEHTGIVCTLHAQADVDDALIDFPTVSTCLYRVAQEALNNVAKHAHSRTATIRLEKAADGSLMLGIRDRGIGMAAPDRRKPQSFGLLGMQERVRAVGGTLRIDSELRVGTNVEVWIRPAPCSRP